MKFFGICYVVFGLMAVIGAVLDADGVMAAIRRLPKRTMDGLCAKMYKFIIGHRPGLLMKIDLPHVDTNQGEEYRIKIKDSNDHKENMMLFLGNTIISWSVFYDERASKSMRRVLAQHNHRLLNNLIRAQISKFNRSFAY